MMALLHFPHWNAAPGGIWWFDGSATLCSYYPDNPELAMIGGYTLRHVRYTADSHDLPEYFTRMAERMPYPDLWETVTLANIDAVGFLDLARKIAEPKETTPKVA